MKRNLLLSITLVLVVALLCGCGGDKKNGTNSGKNDNGGSNASVNEKTSMQGVYVAEDDFYLESIMIYEVDDTYNVLVREPFGVYSDSFSSDLVKDDVISSSILPGEYTIEYKDNKIVFNCESMLIEDLELTRVTGKYDGLYKSDNGYLAIYTIYNDTVRMTSIDLADSSKNTTIKLNSISTNDNGFTGTDKSGNVEVDLNNSKGLTVTFTDKDGEWNNYSGKYTKLN